MLVACVSGFNFFLDVQLFLSNMWFHKSECRMFDCKTHECKNDGYKLQSGAMSRLKSFDFLIVPSYIDSPVLKLQYVKK